MKRDTPHLCRAVQNCFSKAEQSLRRVVSERYHRLNEEMITHLFWNEVSAEANVINKAGGWGRALLDDIRHQFHFHGHDYRIEHQLSGLLCQVLLHSKPKEGKSGGDFGVFVSLPILTDPYGTGHYVSVPFQERAMLVQAKRCDEHGGEGHLTARQKKLLPRHRAFSTLLIYAYRNEALSNLSEFRWQLCKGASARKMQAWLDDRTLPDPLGTEEIIKAMFDGGAGTNDRKIIESVIETETRAHPRFELRFFWKDPPPNEVVQLNLHQEQARATVVQRRQW